MQKVSLPDFLTKAPADRKNAEKALKYHINLCFPDRHKIVVFGVDKVRGRSLYTTHRRAVPQVTARWRASETPHWFSENASDCIRKHEFRWRVWIPCRYGKLGIA
jgi:hypothetical protein